MDFENSLRLTLPIELYEEPYNQERRKTVLMFASILDSSPQFKKIKYSDQTKILVDIEKSCFDKTVSKCKEEAIFVDWSNSKLVYLYSLIASRVSKNLDSSSEVEDDFLIDSIIRKENDPSVLASLSSEDLSPSDTNQIKEKLDKRRGQKLIQKTTTMYTCRNCRGRNCTMRTQQMRSLDEGFSIILNCITCGYRFIVGG